MMCAALKTKVAYTTRDLLIASRLITGESILHSPGVTNSRPTALYPRRICSCVPGIVEISLVNRPPIHRDKTDQAHLRRPGPYSPLPLANRPEMRGDKWCIAGELRAHATEIIIQNFRK
jgi:hypothetical protein